VLISPNLENLIQTLNRLPGIGRKTAQRLAWFLVSQEKNYAIELADVIKNTVQKVTNCVVCNMLSESDPCPICASPQRQDSLLCIVENTADIHIIEGINEYQGKYFVLGHLLSPLDGYGPEQIRSAQLLDLIKQRQPEEIILALKPSAEGEATIHYLSDLLQGNQRKLTRLSTGIPLGG
jgi:recombination protein RecR